MISNEKFIETENVSEMLRYYSHELASIYGVANTIHNNLSNKQNIESLHILTEGTENRLAELIKVTKKKITNQSDEEDLGIDKVKERTYTMDHPEVVKWTEYFENRAKEKNVFEHEHRFDEDLRKERAWVIGTNWHRFSEKMPVILSRAAATVDSNEVRHFIAQVIFEELGCRDFDEIHEKMFKSCIEVTGLPDVTYKLLSNEPKLKTLLKKLESGASLKNDTSYITGYLLGLEIPAVYCIDKVFEGISHSDTIKVNLSQTRFFKIHRAVEIEHIRLSVSNFLRFCKTDQQKKEFFEGFDQAVEFWKQFWDYTYLYNYSLMREGYEQSS